MPANQPTPAQPPQGGAAIPPPTPLPAPAPFRPPTPQQRFIDKATGKWLAINTWIVGGVIIWLIATLLFMAVQPTATFWVTALWMFLPAVMLAMYFMYTTGEWFRVSPLKNKVPVLTDGFTNESVAVTRPGYKRPWQGVDDPEKDIIDMVQVVVSFKETITVTDGGVFVFEGTYSRQPNPDPILLATYINFDEEDIDKGVTAQVKTLLGEVVAEKRTVDVLSSRKQILGDLALSFESRTRNALERRFPVLLKNLTLSALNPDAKTAEILQRGLDAERIAAASAKLDQRMAEQPDAVSMEAVLAGKGQLLVLDIRGQTAPLFLGQPPGSVAGGVLTGTVGQQGPQQPPQRSSRQQNPSRGGPNGPRRRNQRGRI